MTEPLKIYDISNDEMRDITQEDIDRGRKSELALGLMREILRKISKRPSSDEFDLDGYVAMLNNMLGPHR